MIAGAHAKGVALLDRAVQMGFYPADYCERLSPFFQGARGRDDFAQVVTRARARESAFATAVS